MKGSPAYYRPAPSPEHAHLGSGYHLAVETMLRTLQSSRAYDPIGVFVPWAEQNGAVNWKTIEKPDHELVVYPINSITVDRVNAAAYGCDLPWVAVMTDRPVQSIAAEQAWDSTRYDLFATEAVYDVEDNRPAPRIRFLYWARFHDGVGGGRESLDAVAKRLGGTLVFPVQTEISGKRALPPLTFQMVLDAQLAACSPVVPQMEAALRAAAPAAPAVPTSPAVVPSAPAVRAAAPRTTGQWQVGGWLFAAGAAGILWAVFGRKRRTT